MSSNDRYPTDLSQHPCADNNGHLPECARCGATWKWATEDDGTPVCIGHDCMYEQEACATIAALRAELAEAVERADLADADAERYMVERSDYGEMVDQLEAEVAALRAERDELRVQLRIALASDRPWFETDGHDRARAARALVGETCTAFGCIDDPTGDDGKCDRHRANPYDRVDRSYRGRFRAAQQETIDA